MSIDFYSTINDKLFHIRYRPIGEEPGDQVKGVSEENGLLFLSFNDRFTSSRKKAKHKQRYFVVLLL